MLKKGQVNWIDNRRPVLERWCDENREVVKKWPRRKVKKCFGISITWIRPWRGKRWTSNHWYESKRDRTYALAAFKKQPWAERRMFDLVER